MPREGFSHPTPDSDLCVGSESGKMLPDLSMQKAAASNRRFKFQKRSQFFIRTHDVTLTVAAMCISDPDRSPVAIIAETQRQIPNRLSLGCLR